jgi:hypothetical protein
MSSGSGRGSGERVILDHAISFEVPLDAPLEAARAFVRDVPRSLARAHFLRDLRVEGDDPVVVHASLPINAALFGQRELPFRSALTETDAGARLEALDVPAAGPGWAFVAGDAEVTREGDVSLVRYTFTISVHVALPEAERWGGRALTRMIEYTASTVLARVAAAFPEAVARAAHEVGFSLNGRAVALPVAPTT